MPDLSFANIRVDTVDRVVTLTIDRPEVRNALDRETVGEIETALAAIAADMDAGALIVTGAGDRAFAAGADLRQVLTRRRADALEARTSRLYGAFERCRIPVIAAINGHAMGGGCELALACDFRIAASHARFGQPEVLLGIVPAAGATQRLPRIIGLGRAKQMILTGESIDAQTALAWGLVSSVVPGGELMAAAHRLAAAVLKAGPLAVRLAKAALNASGHVDMEGGLAIETLAQAICFESEDKTEGVTAFLNKRPAKFRR